MIIVKIGDGMGNQLFNYACGYAAARRENDTLKLDTSEADNSTLRDFELDKFHLKYDERESFPNRTVFQKFTNVCGEISSTASSRSGICMRWIRESSRKRDSATNTCTVTGSIRVILNLI